MKKNVVLIRLIAIITIISLFVCSMSVSAVQPLSVDEFLSEAGFPQDLIENMSELQKDIIYENSKNQIIRFAGYETQSFTLDADNNLTLVQPCAGLIPSADLTISVSGTYTVNSSGTVLYSTVYPSFVWNKTVKVKNDSFSMAMYNGWEARPGEENLRLHLLNSEGDSAQFVDLNPNTSHAAGYSYKVPSNIGYMEGMYAGYAYYKIDKMTSNASPRIALHYIHDKSPLFNVSYGISISYFSISISPNSDYLYEMAGNYNISGLA